MPLIEICGTAAWTVLIARQASNTAWVRDFENILKTSGRMVELCNGVLSQGWVLQLSTRFEVERCEAGE